MVFIGILLLLVGISGFAMGAMMFGDIGIACMIGAAAAFLSGIGFLITAKKLKKKNQEWRYEKTVFCYSVISFDSFHPV